MKNVAVFFGGESVEHDVSVITGVLTLNSLDREKFLPVPVYVDGDGAFYTGEKLFDVENYKTLDVKTLEKVFFLPADRTLYKLKKGKKIIPLYPVSCAINCMHGERGEDGALSGFLSLCKIPLASPAVFSSSLSMDKIRTKILLKGLNIKTVKGESVKDFSDCEKLEKTIGYPMIIKPNKLGSSIGVGVANDKEELKSAINLALRYGGEVLVEKKLTDFTEINCAAYSDLKGKIIVSECERPIGAKDVLSFADKYSGGEREFPAKIEKSLADKIKKTTARIYRELGFAGIIRIDYFISNGEVLVNEINSVPGSLAYYLFCNTLKEFSALLTEQIYLAQKNFSKESTYIKKFGSEVLNITGAKGQKRL